MKTILRLTLIGLFLFTACASLNTMDGFYNKHKNDPNVSSFQVPSYLKGLMRNVSPELNSLFKNVKDFRQISFKDCSPAQSAEINQEINAITQNYKDVVRKNEDFKQTLVAVKEKGNILKEVVIHTVNDNNHNILFLKGNFDPERIQKLADSEDLGSLFDN